VTAPAVATELEVVRAALDAEYDVIEEIGRGGMAMVFRARERELDREVAIKVLPFALAFDAEFVERFQREARLSAQLEHPHIVPIHRVGRSGQVIYFVMKLLRGQSLSERIAALGRLPAAEVRRVLRETADALGYAHRRGVVHRDVKPDNIMLDADGRCVVTDFGIARSGADTKLTAAGTSLGTPRYMSPEQARAGALDGRSDLYSLGIVGYECLVGRPPFDDGDALSILMDHVQTPLPRPTIAAMGSADARAVYAAVERLLAKRPDDRFQTAEDFTAALQAPNGYTRPAPAPTVPTQRVAAAADDVGRTPQSAAPLDSALAAGLEALRQQRPRVEAGLAAGRRMVDANGPRVRAAAVRLAEGTGHGVINVSSRLQPRLAAARAWIVGPGRRACTVGLTGVVGCWLVYSVVHYALLQRSRCPSPPPSADSLALSAKPPSFALLTDRPGRVRHGSSLKVYYDVCGLTDGAVRTAMTVTRHESGLRRLLGGIEPVRVSEEESVTGLAMRRHQIVEIGDMPVGAYTLDVVVRDAKGRARQASYSFQIGD
jgi:Protein kinase domain